MNGGTKRRVMASWVEPEWGEVAYEVLVGQGAGLLEAVHSLINTKIDVAIVGFGS